MGWFSVASILLFTALIIRAVIKIIASKTGKLRQYMLIVIFSIHIAVIIYLGLN
ncbi:MAG: hypothetical protein RO469_03400 [Thermincola sp.]|nr:hypothetical protein [Thermincola sp.]MDT3702429.1 hypothetical protein [Thermincola sp.]